MVHFHANDSASSMMGFQWVGIGKTQNKGSNLLLDRHRVTVMSFSRLICLSLIIDTHS